LYGNRPAGKNEKRFRVESFAYYSLPKELKQLAAPRGVQVKLEPVQEEPEDDEVKDGAHVSAGLEPPGRKKEN
jgi:hypothetical protein